MFRYNRPYSRDFFFILAIFLGWIIFWPKSLNFNFSALLNIDSTQDVFLTWSFTTAIITLILLYWIDFFQPFKEIKPVIGFVTYFSFTCISGIILKPIISAVFNVTFIRYTDIFVHAWIPAMVAIITDGIVSWSRAKSSVKSTLYLALTDGEKERFIESFKNIGWEKYYRILSQEEFNGALVTGGRIDYLIISRIATKNFILHQNILSAQMHGVVILDYRTLLNRMLNRISIHNTDLWTLLAGSVRQNQLLLIYRGLKFYLEPFLALILLILLLPVFLITAIAIKLTSRGPVFFKQVRTGYLEIKFDLIKFRSMRVDAEKAGLQWASKTDDRITPIGRFLRRSRIDELPQLWNILRGEMSFIGPRPERPEFYEIITNEVPLFKLRLLVRPGITGWAQLLGGYAASIEESQQKLEYDLYYMQYLSPSLDLLVLTKTLLTLMGGRSGQ